MGTIKDKRAAESLEAIYTAALEPEFWPQAVTAIARQHEAPMANLLTAFTGPSEGGFIYSAGIGKDALESWGGGLVKHDIWAQRMAERRYLTQGQVILGHELVEDREFERSFFYAEFLRRQDIWHLCTGIVSDGSRFPVTAISLFRPRRAAPFAKLDRERYRTTVTHVSRALSTNFALRAPREHEKITLAVLDQMAVALVLFGWRGNVVFVNRSARAIFDAHDGLSLVPGNPLTDREGWLRAGTVHATDTLKRLISGAVARRADAQPNDVACVARVSGKKAYVIRFCTLAGNHRVCNDGQTAAAIAFVIDPEAGFDVRTDTLRAAYGLTPCEAQIALEIGKGIGLVAAAEKLGISTNTAKTQLTAVYEKTNTHHQAEIARLIAILGSGSV